MALSDTVVGAGLALCGSLLGTGVALTVGVLTQRAQHQRWVQETRRSAYAELLGAAYRVHELIGNATVVHTPERTDPRLDFSLRLDAARLLGSRQIQDCLDNFAHLLPFVDGVETLDSQLRGALKTRWRQVRDEFAELARDEIGVGQGPVSSRRASYRLAIWCTGFTFFGGSLYSFPQDWRTGFPGWIIAINDTATYSFLIAGTILAALGISASLRGRRNAASYVEKLDFIQLGLAITLLLLIILWSLGRGSAASTALVVAATTSASMSVFFQRLFGDRVTLMKFVRWRQALGQIQAEEERQRNQPEGLSNDASTGDIPTTTQSTSQNDTSA